MSESPSPAKSTKKTTADDFPALLDGLKRYLRLRSMSIRVMRSGGLEMLRRMNC